MSDKKAAFRWILILVCLLAVAALACNAPTKAPETETPEVKTSDTPEPDQETPPAPETLPAAVDPEEGSAEDSSEDETKPTFTPIPAPTLKATLTATNTRPPRPTSTPRPARTSTPTGTPADAGPLSFEVYFEWRLKDATGKTAIARVVITPKGGGGGYTYFRDELPVDGPEFEYEWSTCGGNPISLRVTSADGQTLKKDFFQHPPCPSPTPD
jgi:hypothetical protein